MTWRNIVAPFVFFLTAAIAAGAGTTGLGSVNTPLLLSLLSLSTTEMVPPAQGSIAGASITSLVMWMTRGHPRDPQLPIINADVLLLLLPAMLVGVMFGLTLQSVFPQWFLFLLMTIMTGWSSHKTITKVCFLFELTFDLYNSNITYLNRRLVVNGPKRTRRFRQQPRRPRNNR
jgi:uncharacterized membrane protein YfcA